MIALENLQNFLALLNMALAWINLKKLFFCSILHRSSRNCVKLIYFVVQNMNQMRMIIESRGKERLRNVIINNEQRVHEFNQKRDDLRVNSGATIRLHFKFVIVAESFVLVWLPSFPFFCVPSRHLIIEYKNQVFFCFSSGLEREALQLNFTMERDLFHLNDNYGGFFGFCAFCVINRCFQFPSRFILEKFFLLFYILLF